MEIIILILSISTCIILAVKLSKKTKLASKLAHQINDMQGFIDNTIANSKAQLSAKDKYINTMCMNHSYEINNLNKEIYNKDNTINVVKEQLNNVQAQLDNTKEQLNDVQIQLDNTNEQLDNTDTAISEYRHIMYNASNNKDLQGIVENTLVKYKRKINKLQSLNNALNTKVNKYTNMIYNGEVRHLNLESELDYLDLLNIAIVERIDKTQNSELYKGLMDKQKDEAKGLVKNGGAITGNIINKDIKNIVKIALFTFDTLCDKENMVIKYSNKESCEKRIISGFTRINKLIYPFGFQITTEYLNSKLVGLTIQHMYQESKQREKEEVQEINKKIREEKRRQKEIETQQRLLEEEMDRQLEKERLESKYKEEMEEQIRNIKASIEVQSKIKINNELAIHNIETDKLRLKLSELESKLESLEASESTTQQIEEQIVNLEKEKEILQSGFVYIISNVGAFGENVFKIGVTRRDDPLERVRELSGASVPFKFSVHTIIPSEQAFKLEYNIHKKLNEYRVNLVNNKKEFFKVDTDILIKELKGIIGDIDFAREVEDEQYTQTLDIRNNKDKYINWLTEQSDYFDTRDNEEDDTDEESTHRVLDEYKRILDDTQSVYKNTKVDMKVTKYYVAYYVENSKICTFYKSGEGKNLFSFSITGYEDEDTKGTRNSISIQKYYSNKQKYLDILNNKYSN